MSPSGGFWSLLTILGPILLIVAIAWSMMRNRKEPQRDIDKTERATHDLYEAQDAQDKQEEQRLAEERLAEEERRAQDRRAGDRRVQDRRDDAST